MAAEQVIIDRQGDSATITLNRPERLNALSSELVDDLWRAVLAVRASEPRVAFLQGAGRAFCAGADLRADRSNRQRAGLRVERLQDITRVMRASPFPWVAAVHGYVLGAGAELALSCDIVFAAQDTVIGFPEVEVGLSMTGGVSRTLVEVVGPLRAKELTLLGRRVDATEALAIGLVNRVCEMGELAETLKVVAETIASRPASAVATAKALLNDHTTSLFEEVLESEAEAVLDLGSAPEAVAAASSFMKR
jgi:enoyl-CoA hydratase/carnithine racemase